MTTVYEIAKQSRKKSRRNRLEERVFDDVLGFDVRVRYSAEYDSGSAGDYYTPGEPPSASVYIESVNLVTPPDVADWDYVEIMEFVREFRRELSAIESRLEEMIEEETVEYYGEPPSDW